MGPTDLDLRTVQFPSSQTGKEAEAMKKNDNGVGELLDLIKTHPELISALVFDPASVKRLLKSTSARRLVPGVDTRAFLTYVAGSKNGGPVALCRRGSRVICPKAEMTLCPPGLGTRALKPRVGRTKR
jgi:hypothetical protein